MGNRGALVEENNRGISPNTVFLSEFLFLFGVHFHDPQPRFLTRHLFKHWGELLAWAAPIRIEIDDHGDFRLEHHFSKAVGVDLFDLPGCCSRGSRGGE